MKSDGHWGQQEEARIQNLEIRLMKLLNMLKRKHGTTVAGRVCACFLSRGKIGNEGEGRIKKNGFAKVRAEDDFRILEI
ncbi:MAG: hypothetical protein KJ808_10050 [Acidobacteria bacterium]|nr:hypothetical protein [Acidobacteriota bacterium]MBU4307767.1 hypothetical protein [Acidobacteriota bacterium]MCG2810377.1 hypothetical protein [Candidatus Aminicenantes bacterium]